VRFQAENSTPDRVMNSMTDVNGWPTTSPRWSRTWAGKTGKSGSDSAFLQRTLRSRKPAGDKSRRLVGSGGLLKQYWSRAEWHWRFVDVKGFSQPETSVRDPCVDVLHVTSLANTSGCDGASNPPAPFCSLRHWSTDEFIGTRVIAPAGQRVPSGSQNIHNSLQRSNVTIAGIHPEIVPGARGTPITGARDRTI
jgi:hypothetical protein